MEKMRSNIPISPKIFVTNFRLSDAAVEKQLNEQENKTRILPNAAG
ncbi:hypothetical protein GXM_00379 [Nostoc sphaeroides CCNUC1]|uniref:Uncharacterized protein n=1 Tax=Nostoc sphaeroides CCNUC1 TaxID=2653204 RepID=A0A5P8VRN7_9NOSO|nr:hypothetical protein GXM_00379 [Nostoc sphaeroides CCNUC1]